MNSQKHSTSGKRAVVIGGSMGGLLAARVLADFFPEVTVLERDEPSVFSEPRRGVPQGRHAHGLLASGRRVLDQLFPGLSAELLAHGAVQGDLVREARWFLGGGYLCRPPSGLDALLMSRPMVETAVRDRVRQLPNVRLVDDCTARMLATAPDHRRVVGVRTDSTVLPAGLVIDATGRGSRSPQWLEAIGYQAPSEEHIEIGLGCTTRFFRRCRGDLGGDLAAVIPPNPARRRGGVMLAQEADRWIVTLFAHFGNYPPADLPGFIDYASTLSAPDIYEVVRTAEPLGEAATTRFPASIWRRYDALRRFPEGYLVFGDAISSFNPRYGQGMSVAALQAEQLREALTNPLPTLAASFFSRTARVIATPWTIAATNDLRLQEAQGRRSLRSRVLHWYMARIQRAAHRDPEVALAFHRVANLLAVPASLMHPHIALRVLGSHFRSHRRAEGRSPQNPGFNVPFWRATSSKVG